MRISENLRKLIEEIKVKERERGIKNCSFPNASEVLYTRIMKAGGLKDD